MQLGERMKKYEYVYKNQLLPKTPIIIRLDGKAFHSYTKPLKNKFDNELSLIMQEVIEELVTNIQGAKFAYQQSDEISVLITDWETYETQQAFGGIQSKLESISASMATAMFNYVMRYHGYLSAVKHEFALFDSRVFNLPKEEVCNYFIWRQLDATRNSINSFAQEYFNQRELHGKSGEEMQEMVFNKNGKNWNNLETWKKRGICFTDELDINIPIFTKDREYIDRFLK